MFSSSEVFAWTPGSFAMLREGGRPRLVWERGAGRRSGPDPHLDSIKSLAHRNRSDFCDLRLRCPSQTPEVARFPRQDKAMLHCDLRVRWQVASDLRFRAAISEPKTSSFCRISCDLAPSTRRSLAIAMVRFWCAKIKSERKPFLSLGGVLRGNTIRGNRPERFWEGKWHSERVSERTSERDGFRASQRFLEFFRAFSEVFRGFLEVFRGFSKALSEPLSECHFPLRVAGRVAPNGVAP